MMRFGPFTFRLERRPGSARRSRPLVTSSTWRARPARRAWAVVVVPVLVLATAAVGLAPAGAATTATATGTMVVGVRSVSVTPTTFSFGECTLDGTPTILQFPNDHCTVGWFVITNGTAASHVDMAVSAFRPRDRRQAWYPCGSPGGVACTGPGGAPGKDQFLWQSNWGETFGLTAQCDQHAMPIEATCPLTGSGATGQDYDIMEGPTSSTDQSSSFTITLTWTALP